MGQKVVFDSATKLMLINSGETEIDVEVDLYSDAKEDWIADAELNKFRFPFRAVGGDPTVGVQTVEPYFFLQYGWQVKPQEADHNLLVTGNMFVDGGGNPFVPTSGEHTVLATQLTTITRVSQSGASGEVSLVPDERDLIADAVWDELLTGVTHNIAQSAGKYLRGLGGQVVHTGTAQGSGEGVNQIQLDMAASNIQGIYDPSLVSIIDGTGSGQARTILDYSGETRIATLDRDWRVPPDNTSEFIIYAYAGREHVNEGLARGGTTNTVTLNLLASDSNDAYVGQLIFIRSGTGQDQVRLVTAYNGTTKVATIDHDWSVVPDVTTGYVMFPFRLVYDEIADSIWDAQLATHQSPGSMGEAMARTLGLMQENYYLDNTTYTYYDNQPLLTGGRIRLYDNSGEVGTDNGVIATYNITANWNNNELQIYQVLKQVP